MGNEYTANEALAQQAAERARWAAVLAPVARAVSRRQTSRKNLIARLLGL